MLRDAGIEPPPRPETLGDHQPSLDRPIIPSSVAAEGLKAEADAINARGKDAPAALQHVRRWLERDDTAKKQTAAEILANVQRWADAQVRQTQLRSDHVAAYMLADDALAVLGPDPIGQPLRDYINDLKTDRAMWRGIESMAAYRRTIDQARAIGLLGDWSLIDFQNSETREAIKRVTGKLKLISRSWPNSDAARAANNDLAEWAEREAQATADLPAWRYTWNVSFVRIGTDETRTIQTQPNGQVVVREEESAVYDPTRVVMFGTFQNTSDQPYRYTFVVGVSAQPDDGKPWTGEPEHLAGYERVETPILEPGGLYRWETSFTVENIAIIKRAGLAGVEAWQPARD